MVGGGIAGIATAIALARRGLAVDVFEQAGAAEAVGAGIQLGPNAARALQAIGAYEAVAARSATPGGLVIRDGATGATLAALAFGRQFEARFGMPYRVAHRADLLAALLATASRMPASPFIMAARSRLWRRMAAATACSWPMDRSTDPPS